MLLHFYLPNIPHHHPHIWVSNYYYIYYLRLILDILGQYYAHIPDFQCQHKHIYSLDTYHPFLTFLYGSYIYYYQILLLSVLDLLLIDW